MVDEVHTEILTPSMRHIIVTVGLVHVHQHQTNTTLTIV